MYAYLVLLLGIFEIEILAEALRTLHQILWQPASSLDSQKYFISLELL
jgi:hypothetical protein